MTGVQTCALPISLPLTRLAIKPRWFSVRLISRPGNCGMLIMAVGPVRFDVSRTPLRSSYYFLIAYHNSTTPVLYAVTSFRCKACSWPMWSKNGIPSPKMIGRTDNGISATAFFVRVGSLEPGNAVVFFGDHPVETRDHMDRYGEGGDRHW